MEYSLAQDDFVGISFWLATAIMLASTVFFLAERDNVRGKWKTSLTVAALVTGVADASKKNNTVSISPASVLPLETTLCGLTRLEKMFKNKNYEIVINKEKSARSKAAKIYLTLTRGNVNILDLELRYKGSFTSQPQFLGTLNDQYKLLLEKECGV